MTVTSPPPAPTVADDHWPDLDAPAIGAWTPTRVVSVVVVARDDDRLDRLVDVLRNQTYPADLLDVVVVAAGATVPAPIREGVATIVEPPPGTSPEAAGVARARGDIVGFLAPAAPADETTVEAHARWHHAASGVVTLGWLEAGGWLARYRERTANLSVTGPDHFRAADLRGLAVPRSLLDAVGGVHDPGDPRLASLDLGWRLWCAGALFVPEPFRTDPPPTGDGRPPRSPRLVPPDRRLLGPVPAGAVPAVVAHVGSGAAPEVAATVDALLAADVPGLAVHVAPPADGLESRDDPRLTVGETSPAWSFAPVRVWLPPGVVCAPPALRLLAEEASGTRVGALSVTVPGLHPAEGTVLAAATRALSRAARITGIDGDGDRPHAPVLDVVDRLFGHRWTGGDRFGFARWRPDRPVMLGEVPAVARVEIDVARQLAKRLDEADAELSAALARAQRLDGDRFTLKERLAKTRKRVEDRDRRLARARAQQDELRLRISDAERRAAAAERQAAALTRRRVVRGADALGRLARARRPRDAAAALRDLARALRS